MKALLVLLTGCALFSASGAVAQAGQATARDQPPASSYQPAFLPVPASRGRPVINATQLKICCQKITHDIQRIYYLNDHNGKVRLVVRGIYTRGTSLFFSLKLINRSPLDYDVDSIRFFVARREKGLHALRRLKELSPVYVYDSLTSVEGYSRLGGVYVLPRMSLARHHRLQIEVLEKNGSRHLLVRASNFTLETAKVI